MQADRSAPLVAAARHRHELTRARAIKALRELAAAGAPVTFHAVANAAGVSRSWLYTQPDIKAEIETARAATTRAPAALIPATQRASEASLLRRLEAANQRNRALAEENRTLRGQPAQLLGEQRATRTRNP
jgi:hypothetical protein